ncbi:MAG: UBP-type zinc finger domain-containing protein [Terracidiphilus sp.]
MARLYLPASSSLRTCQECAGTRCCDCSPNRHPSKHAHGTKHPVITSAEPGERRLYCYPDDAFEEYWCRGATERRRQCSGSLPALRPS